MSSGTTVHSAMTGVRIDINSDLGEGFGPFQMGADDAMYALISSANIACGFHGGDPAMMSASVVRARDAGVAVGAHPSFPDRAGFGRRLLAASSSEIHADVLYQVAALAGFARLGGVPLAHVKPHGALYNAAVADAAVATAIAQAVHDYDPRLLLLALPNSELARAGERLGLTIVREAFADRAYNADGSLVARSQPGAVIDDANEVAARMLRLVTTGAIESIDGDTLEIRAESICVHSDTPGAVALATAIRDVFDRAGVEVQAPERTL